ncbi:MAG: ankyrin repeat domain-containing protein [Byssovorax sp.]
MASGGPPEPSPTIIVARNLGGDIPAPRIPKSLSHVGTQGLGRRHASLTARYAKRPPAPWLTPIRCGALSIGSEASIDHSPRGSPRGDYRGPAPDESEDALETHHQAEDIIRGRYRVVGTLGQGGVGTTYEAEDLESPGKRVALKQLNVRNLGDWKRFELFEREARTLAQLVHPAIPRYLDSFQTDEDGPRLYIVQELAPGKTLADLVAAGWHPDEREVRQIAVKVLRILSYLQSLSPPIVHRDVKPQNLLRSDDGEIALVDFGAVKTTFSEAPGGGSTVAGTFGYMAPEQLHGHATTATDLYGLGATLVFLLTRRSPADLPQKKLRIDVRAHATISSDFAAWLDKLLAPAPEDRFATARDALLALDRGMGPAPGAGSRRGALIGGSVLVVALSGVAVGALARIGPRHPVGVTRAADTSSEAEAPTRPVRVMAAHWSAVFSLSWSPDGRALASGSNDSTLKLWSPDTGQIARTLPTSAGRVGAVAFSHDGSTLVSSNDAAITLWDAATGAQVRTLAGASARITALAFDPADQTIWSAGLDGTIRSWSRSTGEPGRHLKHGNRAFTVAVSPNGQQLATGADDGLVKLWDLATGAELRSLTHGAVVDAVAIAPDGQTLISAGDDHTAKVWLIASGQRMSTLAGHTDEVWCVSIQPDGRTVATGGKDGTIRLWDVYSGKTLRSFMADPKGVLSLATSPDGTLLATGGGGGAVKLWSLGADGAAVDEDVAQRAGWDPLHIAAWDGDLAAVTALLGKGTSIDVRNAKKRTPLYNAAKNDHLDVATYLLDHGADVNAADVGGLTPMWPTIERDHGKMVELLLAHGADVRSKTRIGQTWIYKAAEGGHVEILKMLLDKGAPINDADALQWTPLGIACSGGHARAVELLLAQPAIDLALTTGKSRKSPLMVAAAKGHDDIVRQLLARGVDVNARDEDGIGALQRATEGRHPSTAAILREHGAK